MKKITFLLLLGLTGAANAQNTLTPKEMADLFLKGETIQPGAKLVDSKEKSEVNTKVIPTKNQEKTEVAKPKIEEKKVETAKVVPPVVAPKVEEKKVETVKVMPPVVAPKVEEKKVETVKVEPPVVTPKVEEKKVETVQLENPIAVPKVEEKKIIAEVKQPVIKNIKPKKVVKRAIVKKEVQNNHEVIVEPTGFIVKADSYVIPKTKIDNSLEFWKKPLTEDQIEVSISIINPEVLKDDDKNKTRRLISVHLKDLRTDLPVEDMFLKNVTGTNAKVVLNQVKSNLEFVKTHELDLNESSIVEIDNASCSSLIFSYQLNESEMPVNVSVLLNKEGLSVNSFGKDCKKPEVTKERTTVTKSNFLVNYNVNPKELNKNMLSINMYISKDGQYILPRSLRGYAISEDFRNINIMKPENTKGYLVHGMDFKKKKNEKDYYLVFDFNDGVHNNITYGILD